MTVDSGRLREPTWGIPLPGRLPLPQEDVVVVVKVPVPSNRDLAVRRYGDGRTVIRDAFEADRLRFGDASVAERSHQDLPLGLWIGFPRDDESAFVPRRGRLDLGRGTRCDPNGFGWPATVDRQAEHIPVAIHFACKYEIGPRSGRNRPQAEQVRTTALQRNRLAFREKPVALVCKASNHKRVPAISIADPTDVNVACLGHRQSGFVVEPFVRMSGRDPRRRHGTRCARPAIGRLNGGLRGAGPLAAKSNTQENGNPDPAGHRSQACCPWCRHSVP